MRYVVLNCGEKQRKRNKKTGRGKRVNCRKRERGGILTTHTQKKKRTSKKRDGANKFIKAWENLDERSMHNKSSSIQRELFGVQHPLSNGKFLRPNELRIVRLNKTKARHFSNVYIAYTGRAKKKRGGVPLWLLLLLPCRGVQPETHWKGRRVSSVEKKG
jgi:hypothetical protein